MGQRGYTMIELMVILLIVAVLAILAIQSYQTNMIRARVTEGISMATVAKLAVSETTLEHESLPATQADTGYVSPAPTANVAAITIANDGTGEITITYTAAAGGGTIILTPNFVNREIQWTCTGGTLGGSYRPPTCR
jgi:prepilin-type N-terminal cleavage/methylation domain-containing protein